VPSVAHAFTPLYLPPEAYSYVTAKVQADLPAIANAAARGATPMAETIAGALRTLGVARGGGAADDGGRGREPKTIVEAYKETHPTLLRFCNASTVDAVAPVWARLANSHKSEQHTVLTQELHNVCMARGMSTQSMRPLLPRLSNKWWLGTSLWDMEWTTSRRGVSPSWWLTLEALTIIKRWLRQV
jgi:hypothetical protein